MLTLANLINRMNIYTPVFTIDEVRKVNALDQAIRSLRTIVSPPWTLQLSTLRIFQDILSYPLPSDYARLAILDDTNNQEDFGERPRYIFTSLSDFLDNPTYRNLMAEIWQAGTRYLGVRDKTAANLTNSLVNSAQDLSGWSSSGDAGALSVSRVFFNTGSASIQVPITNSTGTATVETVLPNSTSDSNYKAKYFFVSVYLGGLPTSIDLKFGNDSSNYLTQNVTTQFAGQPFVANDWNTLAFDLNVATVAGVPTGTFDYQAFVFHGAPTGTYYIDASFMKGWILQQFWYYSLNNVLNVNGTFQAYFAPNGATYDVNANLIGDDVWFDMIWLDAALTLLSDQKEATIYTQVQAQQQKAATAFYMEYPDLEPKMITDVYSFQTDYQNDMDLWQINGNQGS